jgi:hypothetical protein
MGFGLHRPLRNGSLENLSGAVPGCRAAESDKIAPTLLSLCLPYGNLQNSIHAGRTAFDRTFRSRWFLLPAPLGTADLWRAVGAASAQTRTRFYKAVGLDGAWLSLRSARWRSLSGGAKPSGELILTLLLLHLRNACRWKTTPAIATEQIYSYRQTDSI